MAGAVAVATASMAACGGSSSSSSSKNFCTNLDNAGKSISGDLQGNAPPKATLQKDSNMLTNLANSAPQQLKKPLNNVAAFLKDAEALAAGSTPDSATKQRLSTEAQTVQGDSQALQDYVTKNCRNTGK